MYIQQLNRFKKMRIRCKSKVGLSITTLTFLLALVFSLKAQNAVKVIQNPVIVGDWSDPGVLRVNKDYYSVRSTFGWNPGLQIMHSTDLIHWECIANALDFQYNGFNPHHYDLTPITTATGDKFGGVWGSDIIFNPNTDEFLVYAPIYVKTNGTNHKSIHVFASKKPEGPYSYEGILLDNDIDPGLFLDRDSSLYITSKASLIYRLSKDGRKKENAIGKVSAIGHKAFGEGAEIIYKDGYYHYTCSEGGTLPYEHHKILEFRAKSLKGPWIPNPHNPIKYAPHTTLAPLQGPGHAELIQTYEGEWFMTYHTFEINYPSLARQMCLEPIIWTKDNWLSTKYGRIPPLSIEAPHIEATPIFDNPSDNFEWKDAQADEYKTCGRLTPKWFFNTMPDYSGKSWSLTSHPNQLSLSNAKGKRTVAQRLQRFIMQRFASKAFEIKTKVTFEPSEGEIAGILLYANPENFIQFGLSQLKGKRALVIKTKSGVFDGNKGARKPLPGVESTYATTPYNSNHVFLKITVVNPETARFFYSTNDKDWTPLGDELFFGHCGIPDLGWQRTYWTGATFGLCVDQYNPSSEAHTALFDWFKVQK